jgi:hypothetical protein
VRTVFNTSQFAEAVGVSTDRVKQWRKQRLITPLSVYPPVEYHQREVVKAIILAALIDTVGSPFQFMGSHEGEIHRLTAMLERPGSPIVDVTLRFPVVDLTLKAEIIRQMLAQVPA